MSTNVGDTIGENYEIRDIRQGAMGIVLLCYDKAAQRPVALKTFQDRYLDDTHAHELFLKEATTWVRLGKHRHIVTAHDAFRESRLAKPYIVLELIPGHDVYGAQLTGWISAGVFQENIEHLLMTGIQICLGLEHAAATFGQAFVHRDLKPANILMTADGVAKVADFGLARTISNSQVIEDIRKPIISSLGKKPAISAQGTPEYMAPEQWVKDALVKPSADIYSLGCILYEMATRHSVFPCLPSEYEYYHKNVTPASPNTKSAKVPKDLSRFIMKCLSKDAKQRPQTFETARILLTGIYDAIANSPLQIDLSVAAEELHETIWKGHGLLVLGQYEEAIACFDSVLAFAEGYHDTKSVEKWRKLAEKPDLLLSMNYPQLADVCAMKAGALNHLGRYREAIATCDASLEWDAKSKAAVFYRMKALTSLRQFEEALLCVTEALKSVEGIRTSDMVRLLIGKGICLQHLGDSAEALAALEQATQVDPNDDGASYNKGVALLNLGRAAEAMSCFLTRLKSKPKCSLALLGCGMVHQHLGQDSEALVHFEQALQIEPRLADAWVCKALLLGKLGHNQEAIGCCERALSIDPLLEDAWLAKGAGYATTGRYVEAIECFDRVIEINAANSKAIKLKRMATAGAQRAKVNLRTEMKAAQAKTDMPSDLRMLTELYYPLGCRFLEDGRLKEALDSFQLVVNLDERHEEAWYHCGVTLGMLGHNGDALYCFNRLIGIDRLNADAWAAKGYALFRLNRHPESKLAFDEALRLTPHAAKIWLSFAGCLKSMGEYDHARDAYEACIVCCTSSDDEQVAMEAREAIKLLEKEGAP